MVWLSMSQSSREPEYILAESQEKHLMENQPNLCDIDWDQLVVDLLALSRVLTMQEDTSENIRKELDMLVQQLEAQQ